MLFKPKFFLDLESDSGKQAPSPAAVIAPPKPEAAPVAQPAVARSAAAPAAPAAAAAPAQPAATPAAPAASSLTTAEAIAAELAAEEASRPAPTLATFAPECLTPGAGLLRRRRAGADLAGFREMAGSMLRS
ncbi:MAG: hypothetical protein VKK62_03575 [Synechococcaceae cyanobacterium]|nr:hypothetical protein [Synechococcaceae cyanobacterium]